jgi:hypothetical protein
MAHGKLTAQAGRALSQRLANRGYQVLFDHGKEEKDSNFQVGEIAAWFGEQYNAGARLAQLDIAILDPDSDRAAALIEIEESAASPKLIIGDVFATLLGDHVVFRGEREIAVGDHTTLMILVRAGKGGGGRKLGFLEDQAQNLKGNLSSGNAAIGRVVIRSFDSDDELGAVLDGLIDRWVLEDR